MLKYISKIYIVHYFDIYIVDKLELLEKINDRCVLFMFEEKLENVL